MKRVIVLSVVFTLFFSLSAFAVTMLEVTDCGDNTIQLEALQKGVLVQVGEGGIEKNWDKINKISFSCNTKFASSGGSINVPAQISYKDGKNRTEVIRCFFPDALWQLRGKTEDGEEYKIAADKIKQIVIKK